MDTKQETCAERIADHMKGREEYLGELYAIADGDKAATFSGDYDKEELTPEDALERVEELPLGVEVRRYVRVTLSTGGPADYLDAQVDEDGNVESVSYHFADWFDHAERNVEQDSPLWRLAESYAESVNT